MEATCKWYGIHGYDYICVGPSNWCIGLICSVYCEICLFSPLQTFFHLCIPPKRYSQASLPKLTKNFQNRIIIFCLELCYSGEKYITTDAAIQHISKLILMIYEISVVQEIHISR
jgi:hypothetical protein